MGGAPVCLRPLQERQAGTMLDIIVGPPFETGMM